MVSPICKYGHWFLIIIDLQRRFIIELESLQSKTSNFLLKYASLIESVEGEGGKNPYRLFKPVDLPKQMGMDCGVHNVLATSAYFQQALE